MNPLESGEWHQQDSWILLQHAPILFRGNIPDVTMTTVLRNPVDAISSQILKRAYGFGANIIAGKQEVVNNTVEFLRDGQEEYIKEAIYQGCRMWSGYTYGSMLAIDRIVPFTFEQVTQQSPEVVSNLYGIAGSSDDYKQIDGQHIDNYLSSVRNSVRDDPAFISGASNGIPTEKPQEYYIIKKAVEKFSMIPAILDEYEKAKEAYHDRQKDLGFLNLVS
jgi:hypothetical protein